MLLDIDGMGCEACQLHVRTVIEMSAGVLGSAVDWKAGRAELCAPKPSTRHNRPPKVDRLCLRLVGVNPDPQWGFNLTHISARLEADGYATIGSEMLP